MRLNTKSALSFDRSFLIQYIEQISHTVFQSIFYFSHTWPIDLTRKIYNIIKLGNIFVRNKKN